LSGDRDQALGLEKKYELIEYDTAFREFLLVPGRNYPETGIKNIYGKTPAIV